MCTVPGCDRKTAANGLCGTHDHRRRRGKPLDTPIRQYGVKGCTVEGCARKHTARGLCHLHWKQHRNGPPQWRQRTPDEIEAIRQLHANGVNMTEISRRFDCSRSTVMRIVRGLSFRAA